MNMKKLIIQWAFLTSLFAIGSLAFILFAGNEDPNTTTPMSIEAWLLIKIGSALMIAFCMCSGNFLYNKGYLPEHIGKILKESEEE